VVATANDPSTLDTAILKRPGRFDRVVPFRPPDRDLSAYYLHRLSRGRLKVQELRSAAPEADEFSFAQLRESYIMAGSLRLILTLRLPWNNCDKESTLYGLRLRQ